MRADADPPSLTPAERRREIARLLALGLLRLSVPTCQAALPTLVSPTQNLEESAAAGLELPAELRLSVPTGLPSHLPRRDA